MLFAFLRRNLGLDQLQARIDALAPGRPERDEAGGGATAEVAELRKAFDQLAAQLLERDGGHRTWTKENAVVISRLRDSLDKRMEGLAAQVTERATNQAVWIKETAGLISRMNDNLTDLARRIDAVVAEAAGRENTQTVWTKETATLVSRLRDTFISADKALRDMIAAREIRLDERDKAHLEWAKVTGLTLSEIRNGELAQVVARLESFDRRLSADIRTRTAQQAALAAAPSAAAPPAETRRYGLAGPSSDLELEGLLALTPWVADDGRAAVTLSRAARDTLRELYPPERRWPSVIALRSGLQLEMDLADIFAANLAFGWLQEADDFATFMTLVQPGDVVVDVGANFGLYAAHAALYAGPTGRIVAFEPAPETFALLAGNISRNGFDDRAVCLQQGVAAKAGKASFHIARDGAFSSLRDTGRSPTTSVTEIELAALDTTPALKDAAVNLLKIDVEGGEGDVLAGARKLIDRSPNLIVMMEFSHKNLDEAGHKRVLGELAHLAERGFVVTTRGDERRELAMLSIEDLQGERNDNLFLCRAGSPELRRLQEAVAATPQRAISPAEAAAVALLKRQAVER